MQNHLAVLALILSATCAGAQSSISLDDLGITPSEVLSPADQLRSCLADAAMCSSAQAAEFGLDNVMNLGIVDRGAEPADPSAPRSAVPGDAAQADPSGTLAHLPSIDISSYLSGESPATDPTRHSELAELAALLASDDLAGFEVTLVVTDAGQQAAQDRAQEIADLLQRSLSSRVRVLAETGTTAGITLTLAPAD